MQPTGDPGWGGGDTKIHGVSCCPLPAHAVTHLFHTAVPSLHFIEEEAGVQRSEVTCPKSYPVVIGKAEIQVQLSTCKLSRTGYANSSYNNNYINSNKWLPRWLSGKPGNGGDMGLISGSGRSPGERNGNPPQYSCLGNSMDRGAWLATVHGITKSWTWLSDWTAAAALYELTAFLSWQLLGASSGTRSCHMALRNVILSLCRLIFNQESKSFLYWFLELLLCLVLSSPNYFLKIPAISDSLNSSLPLLTSMNPLDLVCILAWKFPPDRMSR